MENAPHQMLEAPADEAGHGVAPAGDAAHHEAGHAAHDPLAAETLMHHVKDADHFLVPRVFSPRRTGRGTGRSTSRSFASPKLRSWRSRRDFAPAGQLDRAAESADHQVHGVGGGGRLDPGGVVRPVGTASQVGRSAARATDESARGHGAVHSRSGGAAHDRLARRRSLRAVSADAFSSLCWSAICWDWCLGPVRPRARWARRPRWP